MSVQAIIFDLDNCLSPADQVGAELFQPAFDAIRAANQKTLSEAALDRAFADIWRLPLDVVAQTHRFSAAMYGAGSQAFESLQVRRPMAGYGDLEVLAELPAQRFLVTSGFRRLQESKVRALGIAPLFDGIYVDDISDPGRPGKGGLFERILAEQGLEPGRVLVVGDNPASEIAAGNRLGMRTVQILRPGVPFGANASNHISKLEELKALL